MTINWLLVGVLFCLCLPGVFIAMPRVIYFLLPDNTEAIKNRFSKLAIGHTLIMVFVMSITGAILSSRTGLGDPVLMAFLHAHSKFGVFSAILLPSLIGALVCLGVFYLVYYGVVCRNLDKETLQGMTNLRTSVGLAGCIFYGGVVEEVIARWGLMNLTAFFILLFVKPGMSVIWMSILFSGLLFGVGQIPAYLAAGCVSSRRFIYALVLLVLWQSIVFGYLFWQYGLLSAILAHMLFHLGWAAYDRAPA